jgi:hypothetical protein
MGSRGLPRAICAKLDEAMFCKYITLNMHRYGKWLENPGLVGTIAIEVYIADGQTFL